MSLHTFTAPKVWEYLTSRPGETVYVAEITEATGLSKVQIQTALARLRKDSVIRKEVDVVMIGHAWRYMPNRPGLERPPVETMPAPRESTTTVQAANQTAVAPTVAVIPTVDGGISAVRAMQQAPAQPQPIILTPVAEGQPARTFIELGSLQDGATLLRGADGVMYRAQRI